VFLRIVSSSPLSSKPFNSPDQLNMYSVLLFQRGLFLSIRFSFRFYALFYFLFLSYKGISRPCLPLDDRLPQSTNPLVFSAVSDPPVLPSINVHQSCFVSFSPPSLFLFFISLSRLGYRLVALLVFIYSLFRWSLLHNKSHSLVFLQQFSSTFFFPFPFQFSDRFSLPCLYPLTHLPSGTKHTFSRLPSLHPGR